jgi:ABC-type transport system involved in multi-copper enzyme maturation permease subunit
MAVRPRHLAMLVVLAAIGVIDAFWLPMWPETVYRFFTQIFHLDGWAEIVLINNFTGIIFCVYWLGVFDLLGVYVQPREEVYIDLLLSKPVRRTDFTFAKLVPSFIVLVVVGAAGAVVHAGAMLACDLKVAPKAYIGAIAAILAFTILLLAITNLLMLTVRDSFAALVAAFVPFMAAMLPGIVFMYRPDFFAAISGLADYIAFPANLLWHPDVAARFGVPISLTLALAAGGLIAIAGRVLERKDIA